MPGVDCPIVVHDYYPIASTVNVELNSVGTELDGAGERGQRVLRMGLVRTSVGDPFGGIAAATCGQAFLPVVALCSMSAKL
jgi:hypothetical protein